MILLIQLLSTCSSGSCARFKFHYDSINSVLVLLLTHLLFLYLNSIMILLILSAIFTALAKICSFKFHYDFINSSLKVSSVCSSKSFKFHYDSINSSSSCSSSCSSFTFKFHYDSINSCMPLVLCRLFRHLNSIMILLILHL